MEKVSKKQIYTNSDLICSVKVNDRILVDRYKHVNTFYVKKVYHKWYHRFFGKYENQKIFVYGWVYCENIEDIDLSNTYIYSEEEIIKYGYFIDGFSVFYGPSMEVSLSNGKYYGERYDTIEELNENLNMILSHNPNIIKIIG